METSDILKGNKVIAEFMGAISNTHPWGYLIPDGELNLSFDLFDKKVFSNDGGSGWKIEELKFHSSWDWLMQVVEKIESMLPDGFCVFIQHSDCFIEHPDIGISGKSSDKQESTWQACVEFIEWYNEKNK